MAVSAPLDATVRLAGLCVDTALNDGPQRGEWPAYGFVVVAFEHPQEVGVGAPLVADLAYDARGDRLVIANILRQVIQDLVRLHRAVN